MFKTLLLLGLGVFLVYLAATTQVTRGENKGRELTNANIVRSLDHIGQWSKNSPNTYWHSAKWNHTPDNVVILVQEIRNGRIIGAKQINY